jgi:simple sugar transport system permease protein
MALRFSVEPRAKPPPAVRIGVPVASLLAAATVGGLILIIAGNNPLEAYETMIDASFNGWRPFTRTLTLATPLILTGLAAAVAFRMKIWNIGAEGQLYMGAIAAGGLALALPADLPKPLMLVAIMLAGAVAGAVWAGFAAVPKAYMNTDEVITTLMLNFVALSFMNYLIFGTVSFWRDAEASFPVGKFIPESAELPIILNRLHYGLAIAVVAAVVLWWVLRRGTWGFELRAIGDSQEASRYAGMRVSTKVLSVLAVSGALAGIAGAIEVSGVVKQLDPRAISAQQLGFTGIVVAAMARLNPLGVLPVAVLLAAIITSASSMPRVGIEPEIVFLLQGLIFLFVAAGEFFLVSKVSLRSVAAPSLAVEGGSADE